MLAIRMQRTGRSGHAQFRVIVQDSKFSPTRGRVVSYLGSYNPHTKTATIDSEKASQYLQNGAQPSNSVALLFKKEGIKLPDWVKMDEPRKRDVRNPEKRRSTAPAQPEAEPAAETIEAVAEEPVAEEAATESTPETPAEDQTREVTTEESEPAATEESAPQETETQEAPAAENADEPASDS